MTTPNQYPQDQYPQNPYSQNPYSTSRQPVRPPLTPTQKKGAAWGGIVGFNLLSLGFGLFITPIALAAFAGFFRWVVDTLEQSPSARDEDYLRLREFFDTLDLSGWVVPLIISSIVGLAIMAAAVFASRAILRAHAVNKPWAVTWAGAGVAIVASWFLGWIGGIFGQIVWGIMSASGADVWATVAVVAVISLIVAIAVNSVIGWLSWWWMAHVMRAPAPASAPAE